MVQNLSFSISIVKIPYKIWILLSITGRIIPPTFEPVHLLSLGHGLIIIININQFDFKKWKMEYYGKA